MIYRATGYSPIPALFLSDPADVSIESAQCIVTDFQDEADPMDFIDETERGREWLADADCLLDLAASIAGRPECLVASSPAWNPETETYDAGSFVMCDLRQL